MRVSVLCTLALLVAATHALGPINLPIGQGSKKGNLADTKVVQTEQFPPPPTCPSALSLERTALNPKNAGILSDLNSFYTISYGSTSAYKLSWPIETASANEKDRKPTRSIRTVMPLQVARGFLLGKEAWNEAGQLTVQGTKIFKAITTAIGLVDGQLPGLVNAVAILNNQTLAGDLDKETKLKVESALKTVADLIKYLKFQKNDLKGWPLSGSIDFTSTAIKKEDAANFAAALAQAGTLTKDATLTKFGLLSKDFDDSKFEFAKHVTELRFTPGKITKILPNILDFLSKGKLRFLVRLVFNQDNRPQCALADLSANILFNGLPIGASKLASAIGQNEAVDQNIYEAEIEFPTALMGSLDTSRFIASSSELSIQIGFKTATSCTASLAPFFIDVIDLQICQAANKGAFALVDEAAYDDYEEYDEDRFFSVEEGIEDANVDFDDERFFATLEELESDFADDYY